MTDVLVIGDTFRTRELRHGSRPSSPNASRETLTEFRYDLEVSRS
jgi:hypothetical protein